MLSVVEASFLHAKGEGCFDYAQHDRSPALPLSPHQLIYHSKQFLIFLFSVLSEASCSDTFYTVRPSESF